jgi:hypothetical protein
MGFQELLGELGGIIRKAAAPPNYLRQIGDVIDARQRFMPRQMLEGGPVYSGGGNVIRGWVPSGNPLSPPFNETTGQPVNMPDARIGGQPNSNTINLLQSYRGPGMEGEAQLPPLQMAPQSEGHYQWLGKSGAFEPNIARMQDTKDAISYNGQSAEAWVIRNGIDPARGWKMVDSLRSVGKSDNEIKYILTTLRQNGKL